jgi:ribosome-associated translation inhibitor RaiA
MNDVEIQLNVHDADVSEAMRARAERQVRRAAKRIPRVVSAVIRFEQDGALRRVSLMLQAPRQHDVVASAEGRYFGPALSQAIARVLAQASRERKGLPKDRARRHARSRA